MFQILSFLMVVSSHKADLQMAILTFSMMVIISKISVLKLKKPLHCLLNTFSRGRPIFFGCGFHPDRSGGQKFVRPPAHSGATSKMTFNSLVWVLRPADRQLTCCMFLAEKRKKMQKTKKKKKLFFNS